MTDAIAAPVSASSAVSRRLRLPAVDARLAATVAGPLALVALWLLLATARPALFPTPLAVGRAVVDDWSLIVANTRSTAGVAVRGWLWGNGAAIAIAAVVAFVPALEHAALRMAAIVYCLPALAIGPVLQVVLNGDSPKVAVSALTVFFTTLVGALVGLRAAPGAALDVIRASGGGRLLQLRIVRLRATLPHLFAGLRIAGPAAVLGAILGEYLGGAKGLGPAMVTAQSQLQVPRTWALGLAATVLAGAAYGAAALAGKLTSGWAGNAAVDAAVPGEVRSRPHGLPRRLAAAVGGLAISLLAAVAAWWALIEIFDLDPLVAKSPGDVWQFLVSGADAAANRSEVFGAMRSTLGSAATGYVAGTVAALVLTTLFVTVPAVQYAVMPAAVVLQSVPLGVFTPIVLIVFGRGLVTSAVICGIVTFFPTLVLTATAIRDVPRGVLDVFDASGARRFTTLRKAQLPAAVPALLAAARVAVPRSIVGGLLVEWLASGTGIGYLMLRSTTTFEYTQLWAAVVVCTTTMVVLYSVVTFVEAQVLERWGAG